MNFPWPVCATSWQTDSHHMSQWGQVYHVRTCGYNKRSVLFALSSSAASRPGNSKFAQTIDEMMRIKLAMNGKPMKRAHFQAVGLCWPKNFQKLVAGRRPFLDRWRWIGLVTWLWRMMLLACWFAGICRLETNSICCMAKGEDGMAGWSEDL